jgi:hypothetical protein
MKRPHRSVTLFPSAGLALLLAIAGCGSRQPAETQPFEPERVIAPAAAEESVALANLRASETRIAGTVVNNSGREIDDVHLLVNHSFLWKNERNPGRNNPGRTDYYRLAKPIPPGASMSFEYKPSPPLPKRSDGKFVTSVEIMSFSEVIE